MRRGKGDFVYEAERSILVASARSAGGGKARGNAKTLTAAIERLVRWLFLTFAYYPTVGQISRRSINDISYRPESGNSRRSSRNNCHCSVVKVAERQAAEHTDGIYTSGDVCSRVQCLRRRESRLGGLARDFRRKAEEELARKILRRWSKNSSSHSRALVSQFHAPTFGSDRSN